MITKVKSCGLTGLEGYIVEVEIDLSLIHIYYAECSKYRYYCKQQLRGQNRHDYFKEQALYNWYECF